VHGRLRSKSYTIFMLLGIAFAACWPTFASAMTGYTSANKAYIQDGESGSIIPFSDLRRVAYVIHDGDRVALQ
jgi:hypothetical protein